MMCEKYEDKLIGLLNSELTAAEQAELEKHLAGCPGCREELAGLREVWDMMADIGTPAPSAHMRIKFQAMLDTYKESVEDSKSSVWSSIREQFDKMWQLQTRWPLVYSLVIVLVGFGLGYWLFSSGKGGKQEQQLQALTSQVHELKQTMMLALLENPSASERIRGVSYTSEIKHADKEVIDALLATLNNDPNVNVRLSTLDALSHLANHPEVREGLIRSIVQQDSPIMQLAIADVMLKLQEKRSVKSFEDLLKQKDLNPGVRDKIKQTITQLI
jgi:uncharacterized protein HemX